MTSEVKNGILWAAVLMVIGAICQCAGCNDRTVDTTNWGRFEGYKYQPKPRP